LGSFGCGGPLVDSSSQIPQTIVPLNSTSHRDDDRGCRHGFISLITIVALISEGNILPRRSRRSMVKTAALFRSLPWSPGGSE
jgi:hypothetical protein